MIDTSFTKFPDTVNTGKPKVVDANYDNSKISNSDFLKILLTDLQWQDPLNAKDISDFLDNTVKLRQMESLDSFQKLADALSKFTNSILTASSLIGKKVKYEGNQTYLENGKSQIEFKLEAPASLVKVSIIDQNGNVVEENTFKDLKGNTIYPYEINNTNLQNGYYRVSISAVDSQGKDVSYTLYSTGIVNSVYKDENGSISAKIANNPVSMDKILEISM
ncbi:flagellar hook assembly protein FlgD [Sulfurihydrogenibium azorense]|jgi:flagellar basal-body rod modification protein FlgD|uniref:flagellar hook assembly protein FlgD n=1 Tax=Sulfurihydrogenibium azorense TaxID=309806 RepID=UPI00240A6D8A|nr:flagellar hook capping FlgD N-terminal domain-containing protein [Sulfurihydrogenibium azorense]MDM7273758.1 flagellar hook capping FlgD N-terminal domain-containing protein [Sulfurihydrogenibium azorense]